jgi:hypothetical protein
MRLDALDAAAQTRKRACASAAHASFPWKMVAVTGSLDEPVTGSFVHDMF